MSQITLEQIRIATPCPVAWEDMQGDARVRYCSQCSLYVYNLAAMNRDEAETLINKTEGRVCLRLFRREDGTIITRDCPVGRKALHRQVAALVGGILTAVVLVGLSSLAAAGIVSREWLSRQSTSMMNWWPPAPTSGAIAGEMCVVPPPTLPANGTPFDDQECEDFAVEEAFAR